MSEPKKYAIKVTAQGFYLPDQSDVENDQYVFGYSVHIENVGQAPAQLVSRHWLITDADNQVQEVRGVGVVGEKPKLQPGQSFVYTSLTALGTDSGTMRGQYHMLAEDGTRFEAIIPEFSLVMPQVFH